jgi:hypothetical protein
MKKYELNLKCSKIKKISGVFSGHAKARASTRFQVSMRYSPFFRDNTVRKIDGIAVALNRMNRINLSFLDVEKKAGILSTPIYSVTM